MAQLVDLDDFSSGKYELHRGMYTDINLQDYLDRYEKKYLIDLLGSDLYDIVSAELPIPTTPLIIDIVDEFHFDHNFNIVVSEGMKEMIRGFIYYEWVKDLTNQMTINGNVVPTSENSSNPTTLYNTMFNRFNEAVKTYNAIQYRIILNRGDYPEFNGKQKELAYWI
jgi:hypothetical protein